MQLLHNCEKAIAVSYSDCPSSVTVSPSSGPFKAGDVLTCTSDGYPEPSYKWTDSNGVIVSTINRITLTEGWFGLICTASGNFTSPCSASNSVIGNTTVSTGDRDTTSDTTSLGNTYHSNVDSSAFVYRKSASFFK